MTNSYFNLSTIDTTDEYTFNNIFTSKKNISVAQDFLDTYSYMWYYKSIPDDSRLELISYLEYGDGKYWDMLFFINNMESIFSLPTNGDNVIHSTNDKLASFENKFGVINDAALRSSKYEEYLLEAQNINELHRTFRFINTAFIPQLLGVINGL
jgi:hypothetical protein